MALNFETLTIADTTLEESARTAGRKAQENPFVDRGWLKASYNAAKEISVPATEVIDLVNMIRNASNRESLGVSIQVVIGGERWDSVEDMVYLRDLRKLVAGELPEDYDADVRKTLEAIRRRKATVKYMAKDRKKRLAA